MSQKALVKIRNVIAAIIALVAALIIALIFIKPETLIYLIFMGLLRGALYALVAASLSLIFGVMNITSFMQGDLAMIGGYVCYWAIELFKVDPAIAIVLSGVALFGLGWILDKAFIFPLRKRVGYMEWVMHSFVLTLGLSIVFQNMALIICGPLERGFPYFWRGTVSVFGVHFGIMRVIIFCTSIGIITAFWIFLMRTRIGRAIRAVSIDEEAAVMVGVNIDRIYSLTLGLSAMLSGLAGALLLPLFSVYPTSGVQLSLNAWVIVIMAGLGNVKGAIFCSLLLGIIEAFTFYFASAGWQGVFGLVIVILILILRPSGIFGEEVKGIWER